MSEIKPTLEDWLDDLCVRFIINLPENDLSSIERICFHVEEAQWFYEDFIRPLDPTLPSMSLRVFCLRLFAHCPLLSAFSQENHMAAFDAFLLYKTRIPVRGAIMLNDEMDSAVLVKGWKKNANWSFPRGKINKDEEDLTCAIREVYEETGYDLEAAGLVPADRQVKSITINMREQQMRLYVFRNVPMNTPFEPRTRKEISKIQWWRLSDLPTFRKKGQNNHEAEVNANKFYMVAPFLVPLKKWVAQQRNGDAKRTSSSHYMPAAVNNDEPFTEEEQVTDSYMEPAQNVTSTSDLQLSLAGATAALTHLLKIQPPTQGLQTEAIGVVTQSPAGTNSGEALLALLHGRPMALLETSVPNTVPETPFDHITTQPPFPDTPYHQRPQPLHLSERQPPPVFPIQTHGDSFSHQDRSFYQVPKSHDAPASFQYQNQPSSVQGPIRHEQHQNTYQQDQNIASSFQPPRQQEQPQYSYHQPNPQQIANQGSRRPEPQHQYQPQHLIHPQPLPPQVQRALFTGGSTHNPLHQPTTQHAPPSIHQNPLASASIPNQQFPNIHAPLPNHVPQNITKLDAQASGLLNLFKGGIVNEEPASSKERLLERFSRERAQGVPIHTQELPADTSTAKPTVFPSHFKIQRSPEHAPKPIPDTSTARPVISVQQQTLLGMFKGSATNAASEIRPPASTSPHPAVELSAVEPLSSNPAATGLIDENKATSNKGFKNSPLGMNPPMATPPRPVTILARPPQPSGHNNSQQQPKARVQPEPQTRIPHTTSRKTQAPPKQTGEKPFQPQILKRPSPSSALVVPDSSSVITSNPAPLTPRHIPSSSSATLEHKQNLLSLFSKASSQAPPSDDTSLQSILAGVSLIEPAMTGRVTPRIGSLSSNTGDELSTSVPTSAPAPAIARRGSMSKTTKISSADKGFLLNYLDVVAKGSSN